MDLRASDVKLEVTVGVSFRSLCTLTGSVAVTGLISAEPSGCGEFWDEEIKLSGIEEPAPEGRLTSCL